jgi:hypothetical protein
MLQEKIKTIDSSQNISPRIEGNRLIIDGKRCKFPIIVSFNLGYCWKEYRLGKTKNDGLILIK